LVLHAFLSCIFLLLCSLSLSFLISLLFFFFNDTATPEIYTLSLHDALPILVAPGPYLFVARAEHHDLPGLAEQPPHLVAGHSRADRKSTRLNSSHLGISYAVFCLKKKKKKKIKHQQKIKLLKKYTTQITTIH